MALKHPLIKISIHLLLAIIIGIGIISVLFYIYLPIKTKHGETITVPDLQGMQLHEAQKFLKKRNLRLEVFDSSFVADKKPLTILSQNPEPLQNVKEDRKIYITITPSNAPKVSFPDVIDYSKEMVEKILRNNGLKPGRITYRPDLAENAVLEAQVNGVKISKGDSIYKGSTIDLIVGDGRGTTRFLMPKLVGLKLEEAEYTILGSGLKIKDISFIEVDTAEDGIILRSSPSHENESIVRVGTEVKLWVSGNISEMDTLGIDSILNELNP